MTFIATITAIAIPANPTITTTMIIMRTVSSLPGFDVDFFPSKIKTCYIFISRMNQLHKQQQILLIHVWRWNRLRASLPVPSYWACHYEPIPTVVHRHPFLSPDLPLNHSNISSFVSQYSEESSGFTSPWV